MDNKDIGIGILGVFLLILGIFIPTYSAYKLGRHLERKDLTGHLIQVLDTQCEDCMAIGYSKAWKEFQKKYDVEDLPSGRY